MLALAQRICEVRQGRERRGAQVHLETVSEQVYLLLGLTADAGDECIELLRLFDDEDADSGLTSSQIQEFLDRITNLFINEAIWNIHGHTRMMLSWLSKPRSFIVRGQGRCLGGPGAVTEEMKQSAITVFKNWVVLVSEGLLAEFPAHEIMQHLNVFETISLDQLPRVLCDTPLRRLSSAFGVDRLALTSEFCTVWPFAQRLHRQSKMSVDEAWRQALLRRHACRDSCSALGFVFCRKVCWSISTSGLEQKFSKGMVYVNERMLALIICS